MKRIGITGLFLAAVFAFSAMAASSASAAELLALRAGGGSIAGVTFLSSATLPQLITHSSSEIHCKDATNHGVFLSATLGDILIRFLGCTTSGLPCKTSGAGKGEIHLPLATLFHLGLAHLVLATTTDRVPAAVVLLGKIIVIECGEPLAATIEVKGSVIGALQRGGAPVPLNTALSDFNLNFQQTSTGLQHLKLILMPGSTAPTEYFLESNVNKGAFEPAAEIANALLDGFTTSGGVATNIEFKEP